MRRCTQQMIDYGHEQTEQEKRNYRISQFKTIGVIPTETHFEHSWFQFNPLSSSKRGNHYLNIKECLTSDTHDYKKQQHTDKLLGEAHTTPESRSSVYDPQNCTTAGESVCTEAYPYTLTC